jgi:hypothetical protein
MRIGRQEALIGAKEKPPDDFLCAAPRFFGQYRLAP